MRYVIAMVVSFAIAAIVWICTISPPGSFNAFYGMPWKIGVWGWFVFLVAVKPKPECCSEQNRNGGRGSVERASATYIAL